MRAIPLLLLLLAACVDTRHKGGGDSVHVGHRTGQPAPGGSGGSAAEVRFLDHMIEHQKRLGDLLLFAGTHRLSPGTGQIVAHAQQHQLDDEAKLRAARGDYANRPRTAYPPLVGSSNSIEEFRGSEYERRLLLKLVDHYREEVAEIDAALPELQAEQVRSIANRIRSERIDEIRDLTGKSEGD